VEDFGDRLISWYNHNKRDLPWRNINDPYKIWLSEIILQQTRVNQGLAYYQRFVEKYPNVFKLANAPQEEVFKLWQGLGYYNRAANMISAAKTIVKEFGGKFPDSRSELLKLKGVGNYTSAAIASMAFNEPVPVVDGNVYRVISRVFGIKTPINTTAAKKEFDEITQKLMKKHSPGTFNQALMEFGALLCKPRNPNCETCIFQTACFAFKNKSVDLLPVKKPKANVTKRYFCYIVFEFTEGKTDFLYIKKRENNDIWKNLYDFPSIETKEQTDPLEAVSKYFSECSTPLADITIASVSPEYTHLLSHQKIHARFIHVVLDRKLKNDRDNSLLLIPNNKIITYPVPRLIDRYLKEQKIIT